MSMKQKIKYTSVFLLVLLVVATIAARTFKNQDVIVEKVMAKLAVRHFSPKALDNNFSKEVFDHYLKL